MQIIFYPAKQNNATDFGASLSQSQQRRFRAGFILVGAPGQAQLWGPPMYVNFMEAIKLSSESSEPTCS